MEQQQVTNEEVGDQGWGPVLPDQACADTVQLPSLCFLQFLQRLVRLFESSSKAHSVFVSHKRISTGPEVSTGGPHPIVVRATDGKGKGAAGRTKFTTHVGTFAGFKEKQDPSLSIASFSFHSDRAGQASQLSRCILFHPAHIHRSLPTQA